MVLLLGLQDSKPSPVQLIFLKHVSYRIHMFFYLPFILEGRADGGGVRGRKAPKPLKTVQDCYIRTAPAVFVVTITGKSKNIFDQVVFCLNQPDHKHNVLTTDN